MKSVSSNFPKTIASEPVEVKPMGAPIGKLFYFEPVYKGSNQKPKTITLNESRLKPIKLR
jgi:hypothetical protein